MSHLQRTMIKKARQLYKRIYPCCGKPRLEDCFTIADSNYIFWFNTADCSTHTITSKPLDNNN